MSNSPFVPGAKSNDFDVPPVAEPPIARECRTSPAPLFAIIGLVVMGMLVGAFLVARRQSPKRTTRPTVREYRAPTDLRSPSRITPLAESNGGTMDWRDESGFGGRFDLGDGQSAKYTYDRETGKVTLVFD